MIRVLFTIPNFDTAGSGRALLNIARGLNAQQFEPHILCRHGRGSFFDTVKQTGIPLHVFDYITPMRPLLKGVRGCWDASRKLRKINADIVHSFNYSADYSEALAARMAGCRWVYTKKNMNWGGSSKNGWLLRSFLAKRIVVQNTEMCERFFPRARKKTSLVPRGVDTRAFTPGVTEGAASKFAPTIVCVANLVPVKGIEVLIEAFKLARDRADRAGWRLKIVGEDRNEYGRRLKQEYRSLIDSGTLEFTGKVGDVRAELQTSDIFVLPTLREGRMEGSPVSLLEAMAMGLVVIGSDVPGIADQLCPLNKENMFEPGNVPHLSERLVGYMSMSREERSSLGAEIQNYCRTKWDISNEIASHEKLYLEMIAND